MSLTFAKRHIQQKITRGVLLPTLRNTFRTVERVSETNGIKVKIGATTRIWISWSMLEQCFTAVMTDDGYDTRFFQGRFPWEYYVHPCHVHVVGQIFVVAGLATFDGQGYHAANLPLN
jgi:hypothetical protein